jgi:hypothetical protein
VECILDGVEMSRKRHSDVEDFLEVKGKEWARTMSEEHLAMRAMRAALVFQSELSASI